MKYKLINKKSCSKNGVLREGESCRFNNNCIYPNCCETLCDKVTIDGFDYYVSDAYGKPAIATNNPNIDIPKVVDEVEILAKEYVKGEEVVPFHTRKGFISGYNKSQETHPFSLDDVKEIINLAREQYWDVDNRGFSSNTEGDWSFKYSTEDEIIQKYQKTKVLTIFYE